MTEMTTRERVLRMYEHKEADRVPVTDTPWDATLQRWHAEGLPTDVDFADYLGLDRIIQIEADNSPRYPVRTLEETDDYTIATSPWGATLKNWKHAGGVPEFLDFTITDRDRWKEARERMRPERDRIGWDHLKRNYAQWRKDGAWITAGFWFGFDVTHSWAVGTERVLVAMAEDPEWVTEMFNHWLDVDIALFQMVWDEGYHFDEITWPDDMGFKNTTFFSPAMYRNLLQPVHRRAAEWAHQKGIKVRLHSCGFVRPFLPDLLDAGIDMLNPLEVKAGMDTVALKQEFGDRLGFHGGLNAVLYGDMAALEEEMRRVIPVMKKDGGYIISSDHSVPDSVSLQEFQRFIALARELGTYE